MSKALRSEDLIILLGAGASAEANILPSGAMIESIEEFVVSKNDWQQLRELYFQLKSSILYGHGLEGRFGELVPYNIEMLVNTLYELERFETHPIYPFIAAWNSRYLELAGRKVEHITKLKNLILAQLRSWMCPDDESEAAYYNGLKDIQASYSFPLPIFTLNYDRCV